MVINSNSIVFARTRHFYESYTDYFRLVDLCGFPTVYVDEIDVSKHCIYITSPMNGEYRPHLQNQSHKPRNAHLILWNLERPSGSAGSIGNYAQSNRELIYQRYCDEVWVSDRRLADETTLRYVTLGSHYELGQPGVDKIYDFVHMSYETGRRQTIYKHYHPDKIGPNCWPPERHNVLQQSKFALNVHQDHHPFQEPLRFALFAAYGLPILSETVYDGFPWVHDETIIFNGYDGLIGKFNQMLQDDYSRWIDMGLRAREMMCEQYRFDRMVEKAIDESVNSKWR